MQEFMGKDYLTKQEVIENRLCGSNTGYGIIFNKQVVKMGIDETMYGLYCEAIYKMANLSGYPSHYPDNRTAEQIENSVMESQRNLNRIARRYIADGYITFNYDAFCEIFDGDREMMEIAAFMPAVIYVVAQKMGYHIETEEQKQKYLNEFNRIFTNSTLKDEFVKKDTNFAIHAITKKGEKFTDNDYISEIASTQAKAIGSSLQRERE